MKTAKKFEYQQRDPSTVKQRANQRGTDFDSIWKEGVKIFKPKDGKNTVRVLPPTWHDAAHYGYDLFINYGVGVNDGAYLSLSEMRKERDPLAEARRKLEKSGDKETADKLRPTKRVAFYVIDRNAEDEGPQLWPAPWTVDKSFCNLAIDEDTGESIMVDDPEGGSDIMFYKEGTGMTTKYPADKMRIKKPSRLSDDEAKAESWLSQISEMSIPDSLVFYDYDHIAEVFDGHVRGNEPKTAKNEPEAKTATKPAQVRNAGANVMPDEDAYDEETGEVKTNIPPFDTSEEPSNIARIKARLASRRAG